MVVHFFILADHTLIYTVVAIRRCIFRVNRIYNKKKLILCLWRVYNFDRYKVHMR